ncbi:hypothetical protein [Ekhidna sp.]|uniref:hypothetical protein n=1 Tax=Ekhidna sp. TaxID=2608089 RepID=UPI003BAB8104
MKVFGLLFLTLIINAAFGQNLEKQLADTIDFATMQIQSLENESYNYNSFRLNYDDCNLEIHQAPKSDSTKWDVLAFWLVDLDETRMRLLEQSDGEWSLIVDTISEKWKIKYDSETDSGRRNSIILFSNDRKELIELGQALYFAIKSCKAMGRKSDY